MRYFSIGRYATQNLCTKLAAGLNHTFFIVTGSNQAQSKSNTCRPRSLRWTEGAIMCQYKVKKVSLDHCHKINFNVFWKSRFMVRKDFDSKAVKR